MRLEFKERYKSIDTFNPVELPDFTVLTGVNGSGKSHLLEAIKQKKVNVADVEYSDYLVHFNYENFKLESEKATSGQDIANEKQKAWSVFDTDIRMQIKSLTRTLGDDYRVLFDIGIGKNKPIWQLEKSDLNYNTHYIECHTRYKNTLTNYFNMKDDTNYQAGFALIKIFPGSIDKITQEDIFGLYKPIDNLKNNFLPNQIGKIVWGYYIEYDRNQMYEYRNQKYGASHNVYSESEFERKFGPKPWEIINDILKQFNTLDYILESPVGKDPSKQFQLQLVHTKDQDIKINFSDLSSGEQVLMALVASMYKTNSDNLFPKILLLDEIDASLHPSMVRNLLNVIDTIFLQRGMKVIVVTHSPTTIALAPEESVFVMEKYGQDRIKKKDKQEALSILTQGFATLDDGLRLLDQISKKDLSIFTEGNNTQYIEKASEYFAGANKDKIEIIKGLESMTSKTQLEQLFYFFAKVPHNTKVFFVWDCDVKKHRDKIEGIANKSNNTYAYFFTQNDANDTVKTGIENLFDKEKFSEQFYTEEPKGDGGSHISLDKKKFMREMIENGKENDFIRFKPLFDEIDGILKRTDGKF